ncbi:GDNF-inducible zinc finger protein 1-like isoform X1 [Ischnura elegans]|uniref:GDNF-inducible zinc finger protein 1-like isoform X1 n=1 Tax=Ischnura elegans TaxID=197161 RepID=UPI001ED88291|nr:GDNF-inducible zinc finger protein 1-like isoform X1 [Ischnura elegans]
MEGGKSFAVCRLCLCQSENFSGVFDYCDGYTPAEMIIELMRFEVENMLNSRLLMMVKSITGISFSNSLFSIQVSSTDIYPQCVCSTCVKKLTDFKKFKELCCVFKASFDRAYCTKYGGVTFGITSFPIRQTPVPSKIERIISEEGACKEEQYVSHLKHTIPNEDEEEVIVPDDFNSHVLVSTLPIRDVVKEENVTNVENSTETVTDADTTKYVTELDSHSDANENLVDVKNRRDSSEVLAVVENSENCAVHHIVAGSHADRKENACEVEGTMDSGAVGRVSTLPIRDVVKEENVTNVENPTETVTDVDTTKYVTELDSHSDANENLVDAKNRRDSSEVLAVVENSEKCAVHHIVAGSHADRKENACEVEGTMDSGAVGRVASLPSRDVVKEENVTNVENSTETVTDADTTKYVTELDSHSDANENLVDAKNRRDSSEVLAVVENSEKCAVHHIVAGSHADRKENACEVEGTMDSGAVGRVTRSKVFAKEKKKVMTAGSSVAHSQDGDAIVPLDDLEDSESDFQPEDKVDSDISDSSDNEFLPTPPKRSKRFPAVYKGKKDSSEERPSKSTLVAEISGGKPSDGTEASKRSLLMDLLLGTVEKGSDGSKGETPSKSTPVTESSSCQPREGTEVPGRTSTRNEAKGPDHPEMEDHGISSLSSSSETEDSDEDDNDDDDDELESKRRNVKPVHSSEKGVYDCSLCGKRYFQWRTYRYHMDQHKFGNRFKCNECGKAFHRKEYLIVHMAVHETERNFHCDVCGKAFKSSQILYVHKKTHCEKNYVCDICGRKFLTVTKLNFHLSNHDGEKKYPCEMCGKRFTSVRYVQKHLKDVHLKQTKYKYSCEVCGRKCETPAALKSHRMIHSGERPFKCSVCDKAFRTKAFLEQHVNSHTKEKSYKCEVCDAVLSAPSALARHRARHKGEMKYKCDNCGKQYTQSHNLKNHMKKCHTDSG